MNPSPPRPRSDPLGRPSRRCRKVGVQTLYVSHGWSLLMSASEIADSEAAPETTDTTERDAFRYGGA